MVSFREQREMSEGHEPMLLCETKWRNVTLKGVFVGG